jgi:hypothetical protein
MKRALLIGIDEYDRFRGLAGCVNDVDARCSRPPPRG